MASDAAGRCVLRARVAEAPEKGRANHALCRLLADAFGVPGGAVRVESGAASRTKTVRIDGAAPALLRTLRGWATSPANDGRGSVAAGTAGTGS
ncbi:DUF167 domain-containing protein [Zavarzinia sp. CC-PAN008]|uniref:DUF167 domain-containing protein n=1 Tax=Zavarzinia sp. CC-PAN008 TaxID=3243332 RepID=UPI003F74855A